MKPMWLICLFLYCPAAAGGASGGDIPSSRLSKDVYKRQQVALQADLSNKGFHWGAPVFMRLFKQERQLEIWLFDGGRFRLYKQYTICTFGGRGIGPKTKRGDGRAPEGFYYVPPRQLNPYSSYFLAFNLGYPNAYDRAQGRTGGALMVHGNCVSIGCFAMTDRGMEEIYTLAATALIHGQPFFRVHIFPCRMTRKNMQRLSGSEWYDFWIQLKKGYDIFEATRVPPDVSVQKGRYRFRYGSTDRLSAWSSAK